MVEFRWLLEELRVSFFAQELRTPQPVSVKRLEKAWGAVGLAAVRLKHRGFSALQHQQHVVRVLAPAVDGTVHAG